MAGISTRKVGSSAEADFDDTYRFSPLPIPQRSVRKPKLTLLMLKRIPRSYTFSNEEFW